jgi:hypothetical protein
MSAAPVAAEPPPVNTSQSEAQKADVDVASLPTEATHEASEKEIKPVATSHKKPTATTEKAPSATSKATATKPVQKPPQWRNDPGF